MIDLSTLDVPRPVIIAEIGGNHHGDVGSAYELARAAATNGADVVKFQTYTATGLVNPRLSPDRYEHFGRLELPDEEWPKLAAFVRSFDVEWMTSLWDPDSFERLNTLLPAFKIGSGDVSNLPLLARMVGTGKPMIVSTAMCSLEDVDRVVAFLLECDPGILRSRRLALLQCTALYDDPGALETDIAVMETFSRRYEGVVVGFSNHFLGLDACRVAVARGARILEVHVTLDKSQAFRDHRLSVLPSELRELRQFCEKVDPLIGSAAKAVTPAEKGLSGAFRRGIYFRRDAEIGHVVSADDLVLLRPEVGLPAWHYYDVLGRIVARPIGALEPLSWDAFVDSGDDAMAAVKDGATGG